jgi:hypothetical protein
MAACFFAGDCGSSESHNTFTSNFSQLSSQTSTFIKTNSQKTAADVMNIQSTNLDVKNMGEKCDINISQSINLKQQTSGQLSASSLNDLRSMLTTGLQNMATQNTNSTAQMGSGALTQSTNSSNDTTLNSEIQNVVNTTCSDSNYNELVSTTLNKQDATVRILNCNGKLTIGQSIVADVITKNLMDTMATNLQTNTATANVFNQLSQTSSSSSQGLAGLVDSFANGIKNILGVGADAAKTISYIIGCIIVVAIAAALYFLLSPAGQKATTTLAEAGASKIKGPLG